MASASPTLLRRMASIKHKVMVLSGKGGVGKSTVSTQLALALVNEGKKVGLLDVDICGPSVPKILGLEGKEILQCSEGWVPVFADDSKRLSVMSIGFMLGSPDEAVVWRGPKKTAMIRQFLEDVYWQELDYLIIDTPPGTSDEHISIAELLREAGVDGAVIVTTPQGVAINDVRKEISFCRKLAIPILGIIENMSGFVCPHCSECTEIFLTGGGEKLAEECELKFLGRIPIDMALGVAEDEGKDFVRAYPESSAAKAFVQIVDRIVVSVEGERKVENDGPISVE